MTLNAVILVDQTSIPGSFDAKSLFFNGQHILDDDETSAYPISEIAEKLAKSMGVKVSHVDLSQVALAKYMAGLNNTSRELEERLEAKEDIDDFVQDYTNDHVLGAIGKVLAENPSYELLISFVNDIQTTGGLIEFNDGQFAPSIDNAWIDLGSRAKEAYDLLKAKGQEVNLDITTVNYPSSDVV